MNEDDAGIFVRRIKAEEMKIREQRYRCRFTHNKKYRYRYFLECCWDENRPRIVWIGLNPSNANKYKLDTTLYRVLYYSYKWNFGSFVMLNAFAQIDSDPHNLDRAKGIGAENNRWIKEYLTGCSTVLCAWSNCGRKRQNELRRLLNGKSVWCIGVNADGYPKHPSRKANTVEKQKMEFVVDRKGDSIARIVE